MNNKLIDSTNVLKTGFVTGLYSKMIVSINYPILAFRDFFKIIDNLRELGVEDTRIYDLEGNELNYITALGNANFVVSKEAYEKLREVPNTFALKCYISFNHHFSELSEIDELQGFLKVVNVPEILYDINGTELTPELLTGENTFLVYSETAKILIHAMKAYFGKKCREIIDQSGGISLIIQQDKK
nr:hypothetical protein [Candidatus Gracilibacteria bacterium]